MKLVAGLRDRRDHSGCRYAGWPVTEERKAGRWIVDEFMDATTPLAEARRRRRFRNLGPGRRSPFVDRARPPPSEDILKETRIAYGGLRSMKIKITGAPRLRPFRLLSRVTDVGVATIVEKAARRSKPLRPHRVFSSATASG
jgi:hypothetical protein